jgi:hypothetical protein
MSWAGTELEVIRWSEARGIIANSDSKTQLLKAVSEMGELADAIIKRFITLFHRTPMLAH